MAFFSSFFLRKFATAFSYSKSPADFAFEGLGGLDAKEGPAGKKGMLSADDDDAGITPNGGWSSPGGANGSTPSS